MSVLDQMEVFYGDSSPTAARVYVRCRSEHVTAGWQLSGVVRGPHCATAHTLPVTTPLKGLDKARNVDCQDRGLLACAHVPDPCFWSPRLPALYEVQVELGDGHELIETATRWLGIRHLGVAGQSLLLEGKRWVVRAVGRRTVDEPNLALWREASVAMLVENPEGALCDRASHEGVLLVARITASSADAPRRLRELSRWAAVAMAIVERQAGATANLREVAPNILLAQPIAGSGPVATEPWAQLVARQLDDPVDFSRELGGCRLPVLALRAGRQFTELGQARAECDRLQRDLAPYADVAGYLVT